MREDTFESQMKATKRILNQKGQKPKDKDLLLLILRNQMLIMQALVFNTGLE